MHLEASFGKRSMRILQTLADAGTENNPTIVFPVPVDLFTPFLEHGRGQAHTNPLQEVPYSEPVGMS
jgi:hypothetical protein